MTGVWANAGYEGGALLVLLALADFADDQGYCFPSVKLLARKSRLSTRQVNNVLTRFKNDGSVVVEAGGGSGRSNRYRINTEMISEKNRNPEMISVKSATQTLKSATQNTEICDSAIRKNRHEPSVEPSGGAPPPHVTAVTPKEKRPVIYAKNILATLGLTNHRRNVDAVVCAIELEVNQGKTAAAACEFIVARALEQHAHAIMDPFYFVDWGQHRLGL
jgi:hypothetical protein